MSSSLKCGCKIIGDIINLNDDIRGHNWNYMLRTFVNKCGKCGDKQLKFQEMENKLIEMEKTRMKMMTEDEEEETEEINYEELKEYLKTMSEDERENYRKIETLRNLANGLPPDYKMYDIYRAIKELKEEEEEEEEEEEDGQSDGNQNLHDPYDLWSPRTRAQYERDMERQAEEEET